jgi:hypothetical protein
MKKLIVPSLLLGLASALSAAEPKETAKAALKALCDKPNYSWTLTIETDGAQRQPNPIKGMTEKDGCTCICMESNNGMVEAVIKGDQRILKTDEGWKTAAELRAAAQAGGGGGANRGAFLGRALLNTRTPTALVEELLGKIKELKAGDGGVLSADIPEEAAKDLLTFGRGRGAQAGQTPPPAPRNAKGALKLWVKDGLLAKIETKVQGTVTGRDQQERDVVRTSTIEIKDVGTTKVKVSDEAKKKLSS